MHLSLDYTRFVRLYEMVKKYAHFFSKVLNNTFLIKGFSQIFESDLWQKEFKVLNLNHTFSMSFFFCLF